VLHVTLDVGPQAPFQALYVSLHLFAAAICAIRGSINRPERRTWWAFAAGMVLWAGGYAYYFLFLQSLESPPYPSPSDGLWIAFYVLAFGGLLALVRSERTELPRSVWIDGLTAAVAVSAVAAALLLEPIRASTGASVSTLATNLAYPLADVLILGLVLAVFALQGWRPGR